MGDASDKALIDRLQQGEERAYLELFDRLYTPLREVAYIYVSDYDVANDIVQNTLVSLYENRMLLGDVGNLEGYLRIAVRNRCYNYLRDLDLEDRRKRLYWEEFIETELSPTDKSEFETMLRQVQQAMDCLPDKCAPICRMRFFEGKKIKEIAEELGITEGAVKTQLHRGVDKIRESLATESEDERQKNFKNIITFSFIL